MIITHAVKIPVFRVDFFILFLVRKFARSKIRQNFQWRALFIHVSCSGSAEKRRHITIDLTMRLMFSILPIFQKKKNSKFNNISKCFLWRKLLNRNGQVYCYFQNI